MGAEGGGPGGGARVRALAQTSSSLVLGALRDLTSQPPPFPHPRPSDPQLGTPGAHSAVWQPRPQCVCGLEAGSHSPSSSSGPAGGEPSSPSCSSSFSSSCKTRRGSEPGHDRTGGSLILSLGCLTLGKSDLTPGHTLRSDVPQQQGGQKGVTASVRRGSSGQTVGEGGRGCPGPAWARTAFERVWEDSVRAKVNSR